MKKSFLFVLLMLIGMFANTQVNPHAIGLRLRGDGHRNGAEISYQYGLGSTNRLEIDLYAIRNRCCNINRIGLFHRRASENGGCNNRECGEG